MKLHHLNNSRSFRVFWLLEELGLPFEVIHHQRHPETQMGPAALKAAHPLGKAPALETEHGTIVESGAIIDYIIRRYGNGALAPANDSPDLPRYLEWMNIAVSIGTMPIMLKVYGRAAGLAGTEFDRRADAEFAGVLGYIERSLEGHDYLVGDAFSAADIQVSFIGELARVLVDVSPYPQMIDWMKRLHARPAFRASIEKGGEYAYAT
ncbi:glutathione S-transferase family protein [Novosphingobium sp. CCH12-A3]|uniref:glutathione S-transferase family protein n=1 Tax=Novosphingobium sp. CCH12-A3 TaxID=1768752 RepID=UPI000780B74E|nr:glutathione S-transferase family protein [Novosphingobium sp. CCH12-A3]